MYSLTEQDRHHHVHQDNTANHGVGAEKSYGPFGHIAIAISNGSGERYGKRTHSSTCNLLARESILRRNSASPSHGIALAQ